MKFRSSGAASDDENFNRAVRRASVGLTEAVDRFNRARTAQLIDHTEVAATEAAIWIVVLDQLFGSGPQGKDEYRARRDADDDGRVVLGVIFARNEGVHSLMIRQQWTDEPGILYTEGLGRDLGLNVTEGSGRDLGINHEWFVRWGEAPDERRPTKPSGQKTFDAYRNYLQGQWVHLTLRAAARWFEEAP